MFKNPFSFEGRIGRTEYGLSFIIYVGYLLTMKMLAEEQADNNSDSSLLLLIRVVLFVPTVWFLWAQGAKRCHDVGQSGWLQIIPFYFVYLIFGEGNRGENNYGQDPKQPVHDIM